MDLAVAGEVPMGTKALPLKASFSVDPAMLDQCGLVHEGLATGSALAGPLVAVGPLLKGQGRRLGEAPPNWRLRNILCPVCVLWCAYSPTLSPTP